MSHKKLSHFRIVGFVMLLSALLAACQTSTPTPAGISTALPQASGQATALPNTSGIDGVQVYADKASNHDHVTVVPTPEGKIPPVFGAHFPAWQNCGIYDQPVELGSALHSMEHGAVWLTYRPDLSVDEVKSLQDLVRGHGYVLMSPYEGQSNAVVLTAWGVQLLIDKLPDDRIAKFIAYYEQGPQDPERGAPCSGAIGNPLP